jgi:hypothetical protein
MTEPFERDADVISALDSLRRSLDAIPAGDVVSDVRAAIDAEAQRRRKRRRRGAGVAVAAIASTLLVPGVRTAVAHRFGIGGVNVHRTTPEETVPAVGASFDLGRQVDLEEVRSAVDYTLRIPSSPDLPRPTAYLRDNGIVSLVYPSSPTLPASAGTDVGLIITQFTGDSRDIMEKFLDSGPNVRQVTVNDQHALWITGGDHYVFFVNQDNGVVDVPGHVAGNTLLWVDGGVTVRLEANISQAEAVRIAESMA